MNELGEHRDKVSDQMARMIDEFEEMRLNEESL